MKSRHRTFVGCARVSSPKMDEHFDYIITFNVICPFGCICLHSAAVHDMVNICLCDGVSEVIRGRRFHKTHGGERQAGRMGVNSTRVTTIPIQKDESDYPAARGSVGCPLRCPEPRSSMRGPWIAKSPLMRPYVACLRPFMKQSCRRDEAKGSFPLGWPITKRRNEASNKGLPLP